jgi:hypothetical protein
VGFRKGFFLGFLIGSAIASLKGSTGTAEAPGIQGATGRSPVDSLRSTIDSVRARAREALEAAHEAQDETEQELNRRLRAMQAGEKPQ